AGSRARGADLYVTLEPCAHHGRTPPCADALVAAGVRRVVAALRDPNPLVSGRGFRRLARAGVVVAGAGSDRRTVAERQNEKFIHWVTKGRPFVLAKWASTLDGKIAAADGRSRWITGPSARRRALLLREEYDAVLVGAGTMAADDPRLTRRLGKSERPHLRIVLDGKLEVSGRPRLFRKPNDVRVVTSLSPEHPKVRRLARRGIEIWSIPGRERGRVDLRRFLSRLGRAGVTSLIVEGGAETLASFFQAGLVDRVQIFFAPRILAGRNALSAVGGLGFPLLRAPVLAGVECERVGPDLALTGRIAPVR
ncbi:MAG TPA: bifunctional diaminohydroxyphosphoribosylaminopyrimidine deaminase/5-amino-6-(5-phosphoribosylamino)uracil reductase RibD, partial [Thermoanaerobaculia bacterium]